MMLRARVALHLGQRPPESTSEWAPERRAGAWEPGMVDIVAVPVVPPVATVPSSKVVAPVITAAVVPVITAPDTSRVHGEAYAHGVYRLFVRGPARRPSPGVMASDSNRSAPVLTPMTVAARPIAARVEPEVRTPIRASTVPEATLRAPVVVRAAVDGMAFGPDRGGFVHRVVDWPLVPGARPELLGGALARLGLPDAARMRGLLPRLLTGATPGASGSPLVFLDVETTALDRGAGALAFMVGLAAYVDGALRVEQWILTRLTAEAAMLAEVLARVVALGGPGAALASFNGASFDVPLLRNRLRRAGLSATGLQGPHLDLLPLARRMWRGRGPDCRLITLERTQLGVRRVHDIEGHEIPAVFWAWLRNPGDPEVQAVMGRVADHNLADLVTLPALGAALGGCLEAPGDLDMAVRAAEHSLAAGRREEALALLGDWLGRPAAPVQRRRALLLAADLLRRDAASRGRAAELWAEVCRICPGDPAAHEALAKHLEHHTGELARALEVARGSVAPCPRRVARLRRKLSGSRSGQGPLRAGAQAC